MSVSSKVDCTREVVEYQWRKERDFLERKNQNLQWANSDLMKQVYETAQRGHQLALNLGFRDITEAESFVASQPDIEQPVSLIQALRLQIRKEETDRISEEVFRDTLRTMQQLRSENRCLRSELKASREAAGDTTKHDEDACGSEANQKLPSSKSTRECSSANKENSRTLKDLTVTLPGSPTQLHRPSLRSSGSHYHSISSTLPLEFEELQHRYESLLHLKNRAAERYRKDYKKWRDFKVWLLCENTKQDEILHDLDSVGRMKYKATQMTKKWKRFEESGPDLENGEAEKGISVQDATLQVHRLAQRNSTRERSTPAVSMVPRPTNDGKAGCSLPVVGVELLHEDSVESRTPMSLTSLVSASSPERSLLARNSPAPDEEYMGLELRHSRQDRKRKHSLNLESVDMRASSDTEDDSQAPDPVPLVRLPDKRRVLSDCVSSPRAWKSRRISSNDDRNGDWSAMLPPIAPEPPLCGSVNLYSATARLPARRNPIRSATGAHQNVTTQARGNDTHLKNATRTDGLEEYTKYKGRGRYARNTLEDQDLAINAQYEIEKNRNSGLDFQYDTVVRKKQERKHLGAGDCECCRDYYEAVGPLPQRLELPKWRSPPSSPTSPRHCHHQPEPYAAGTQIHSSNFAGRNQSQTDVIRHKQKISRHRHQWERATTPPGYWDIGFPTTQEAMGINAQAKEMHRLKKEMVETEARKHDGKYKKR